MSRARSFTAVLAIGIAFLVTGGCYGATEATVVLSTDLLCTSSLRTMVYIGAPNAVGTVPVADTTRCNEPGAPGADHEIGTLTILPGEAKDGRVEVRAVVAQNGQDPATCADDGATCIVQTRTFSFVEHSTQNVPIRLLRQCLGTVCPAGQTCTGPQQCASNELSCTSTNTCTPSPPVDGGRVIPAGACERRGRGGVLATASSLPKEQLSALARGQIYWFDAASSTAHKVAVDGTGDAAVSLPVKTVTALADGRGGEPVAVAPDSDGADVLTDLATAVRIQAKGAFSIAGRRGLVVVGANDGLWAIGTTKGALPSPVPGLPSGRVALTSSTLFVAIEGQNKLDAGVYAYTGDVFTREARVHPFFAKGGELPVFAVTLDGARAWVAGADVTRTNVTIARLGDEDELVSSRIELGNQPPIASLAVAGAQPFWTTGVDGIHTKVGLDIVEVEPPQKVTNLAVDGDCLYYWIQVRNGAELRARSRP